MKIRLPSLREGENPLNEKLDAKVLGLDEEIFKSPVYVTAIAVFDGQMVDVRMSIKTSGSYVCDRCAEDFIRDFDVESRVVVLTRDSQDIDEEEAEGLITIGARGTEADLSQEVVDAIFDYYEHKSFEPSEQEREKLLEL